VGLVAGGASSPPPPPPPWTVSHLGLDFDTDKIGIGGIHFGVTPSPRMAR